MELINVPHIFNDPSVKAYLPADIKFDDPTVVYSNFNKFASNLHVKSFLQDNTILPCYCAGSGFIDKDHPHTVIGDLRIVGNNILRKLFTSGLQI